MSEAVRVSRFRGVSLAAPGALRSEQFYSKIWGLTPVDRDAASVRLRAANEEHHVLELIKEPEPRLAAIELGVDNAELIQPLFHRAKAAAARIISAPRKLDTAGGGYGFEILDTEGRLLRITAGRDQNTPMTAENWRPQKVAHIVLNSPDLAGLSAFYCGALGFEISDWSEEQMVFLRCDTSHHNIALNRSPISSFNHVSFHMATQEAVMMGIGRMKAGGHPLKWGPGCHTIGDIMFAYFVDPNGFVIEYNHYLTPFQPQGYISRVWRRSPDIMDKWGTAGPPSAEIREAMAGKPHVEVRQ